MRMRKSVDEYYRALGVSPGASAKELRRAYLRLVKRWHPDQFAGESRSHFIAQEKLKEINEAYTFLKEYRPGQTHVPYGDGYSWPSGYSRGATEEWRAYRRRAYYEPPIVDPYEGDYQYRPVGNSRGMKWGWIFAIILIANLLQWGTGIGSAPTEPSRQAQTQKAEAAPAGPVMDVFAAQPAAASQGTRTVPSPLPYFFVGSTKADVYRIQGMPQWSSEGEWRYGTSRVYFRGPMVEKWESTAEFPLKTIKLPKVSPDAVISQGATIAEVLAIQGTPVSVNDVYWTNTAPGSRNSAALSFGKTTYWYYGASSIEFSGDKVIGWTEKPGSPLRAAR
jgi:hypothetical protein